MSSTQSFTITDKNHPLNAVDDIGETALYKACYYKLPDVAIKLLDQGADFLIADKGGCTPLMVAISNKLDDVIACILERISVLYPPTNSSN